MKLAREDEDRPTELGRLLAEALRCLKGMDLPGANAALKKVHAEASLAAPQTPPDKQARRQGAGQTENELEDRG